MLSDLSFCRPRVSCVLDASVEDVWNVIRDWSKFAWIDKVDGTPLEIYLVEGAATAVGSVRAVRMGPSLYFEKLVGLDDEIHVMKWRLVTHPDSVSPFPDAAFINFTCQMSLAEVTHGNVTFAEFRGTFYTEHEHTDSMVGKLEHWFHVALQSLQDYMLQRRNRRTSRGEAAFSQQQRTGPVGSVEGLQPVRHAAERSFPSIPRDEFAMPSGPHSGDSVASTSRDWPPPNRAPLGSQKPMGQTSGAGMPPISTGIQLDQQVLQPEGSHMRSKMPSIGVGQSTQMADTQRWAQFTAPGSVGPGYPETSQGQGRPAWPPQNGQWPYQ